MTAPGWIAALVRDFGRAAGLSDFALNARGVAAVSFENGLSLRFEFAEEALTVAVTVPVLLDPAQARTLLAYAHPDARFGMRVRTGYLVGRGRAVFAIRLDEREATLPVANHAFDTLWHIAQEFGGLR